MKMPSYIRNAIDSTIDACFEEIDGKRIIIIYPDTGRHYFQYIGAVLGQRGASVDLFPVPVHNQTPEWWFPLWLGDNHFHLISVDVISTDGIILATPVPSWSNQWEVTVAAQRWRRLEQSCLPFILWEWPPVWMEGPAAKAAGVVYAAALAVVS